MTTPTPPEIRAAVSRLIAAAGNYGWSSDQGSEAHAKRDRAILDEAEAALFRAVADLAARAEPVADAQREEDAADPRRFPTIWPGRVRFTFESDETSFYVEADNSSPEARAFMFDDFVKSLQERTDIARARPGWREGVEAAAAVAKRAKDHRFDCCARGQPDEMSLHGHRSAAYEAEEIEAAIRALKEPT